MHFSPKELVPEYLTEPHVKKSNPYEYDCYLLTVTEYLTEIFARHFTFNPNSFYNLDHRFFNEQYIEDEPPQQSIYKDLMDKYHKYGEKKLTGKDWLEFFYLEKRFGAIKVDEYRDFVELASPLDWMGKEELQKFNSSDV